MPWKDIEKQRAAIRKHYYANREKYIQKALKRKKGIRKWLNDYKESSACVDCKTFYPYYVMDFDHIADKSSNVSQLINTCSMRQIKAEIARCELVCSNCHRIRTFKRLAL
ncbi:hypothetical protein EKI60_00940 [Candidatus Saccharibacteria bacterium]|nr:MAG: hypothetical protein EKI60_00940 [Candidatus Saccharibacteria bacterium]